jgi:hypothetical protein
MRDLAKRAAILDFEEVLKQQPQLEIKPIHRFCSGVYIREIYIPKGCVLTGKIHRTEHFCELVSGRIAFVTTDGAHVEALVAPALFTAAAGTKKAIYAVENSVFRNILATNETDPEKIEALFIAPTFEALEAPTE